MIIKLIVDGGDMKPGPAIGQKLGPLGINIGKVIEEVNKATSSFKGMKVPVMLDIDAKTKNFCVEVETPSVAELLKKELGIEKGSGMHQKIKVGNLAIEQIIRIAETKQKGMLVNDLKAAVKNVLGSCVSLGILVENKNPKEIIAEVNEGKYNDVITKKITSVSAEKKAQLDSFFSDLKAKQDKILKKEAEEAAAKAAAAPSAPETATGEKQETRK